MPPTELRKMPGRMPLLLQIIILAALGLLVVAIFVVLPLVRNQLATHAQAAAAPATAPGTFRPTDAQWAGFKIATVQTETFRDERFTDGKIANNDDTTTPVFSPYSGRVTKLFVKAGDHVGKGGPLLAIAAAEFVQGQNDLISAVAALNTAHSQMKLATINEQRQRELFEAKAGALKDWQQSQADLESARNAVRSAEIALAAVRNRLHILGKSDAEINVLETMRDAEKIGPEAIVVAPISGVVTQRQVGLGQYINSASNGAANPVFAIGDLSTVWLLANVRETDAPLMHVGQPVEVHVLAYPKRAFRAKIAYVAPSVDPNTHRLSVRAEVENDDGALKPEMFASFSITVGTASVAASVPESAVVYEGETARVWVVRDDKSLALRPIHVGRTNNGNIEVLSGLTAGEKVVTSGSLFIDRAATAD